MPWVTFFSTFRKKTKRTILPARGFTLIETLVGILLLTLVSLSLYALFQFALNILWESKVRVIASALANQKMEEAHNLSYADVGTINGIPAGSIPQEETIMRNNIPFTVRTTVLFVDDIFDGTQGGNPDDLYNNDYKRVEVEVTWPFRKLTKPVIYQTDIVPKGLESDLGGGTMRILVFDANATPVEGASVRIVNTNILPNVDMTVETGTSGIIVIPGAKPSFETYHVTVSKTGYSTDQTFTIDPANMPSSAKPPLSVFEGLLTDASFSIDRVSSLTVRTLDDSATCDEGGYGSSNWWDTDWQKRLRIRFDTSSLSENQTDTPVLVSLSATNFDFSDAGSNGQDIRFVDTDNATLLPYEIEQWDATNKQAAMWVRAAHITAASTTDHIWMYYDNTGAPPVATTTGAWSDTFVAVHHFEDDPGPGATNDITDSTRFANHGTAEASMTTSDRISGIAGYAFDFDGNNDSITIPDSPLLRPGSGPYTLEAWLTAPNSNQFAHIAGKVYVGNPSLGISLAIGGIGPQGTPGQYGIGGFASNITSDIEAWFTSTDIADTQWHYVVLTLNNSIGTYSIDAQSKTKTIDIGAPVVVNSDPLEIGNAQNLYPFLGAIDEVRISNTEHSAQWISFQKCATNQTCLTYTPCSDNEAPIPNIPFILTGEKLMGSDASGNPVFKYSEDHTTGSGGEVVLSSLEWDSYTPTVNSAIAGYDIAYIDPFPPINILPNTASTTTIGLFPDQPHTLRVLAVTSSGMPVEGVTVHITNTSLGTNKISNTPAHGQTFFSQLTANTYTLTLSKNGYHTSVEQVAVNGDIIRSVTVYTLDETPPSPPSPPSAPSNLSFSNITKTSADLAWNDTASNEDGYRIYRNTSASKPQNPIITLSANSSSYQAILLDCNTTYYWWIEAYNTDGDASVSGNTTTNACGGIVFTDTFTANTNQELNAHMPDTGNGWTRIIENGSGDNEIGVNSSADDLEDNNWCGNSSGVLYHTNNIFTSANYEVSVRQRDGDTSDDVNILAARIQDANNMYVFEWNEDFGMLWKRTNGTWAQLGSATSGIGDGSIVTLKVNGSTISALDDGIVIRSVTDATHSAAGHAGIGLGAVISPAHSGYDCSSQKLDDFSVNITS